MIGRPWYAWEWLYDLLIAAVYNFLGLNGIVFVTALIISATLALVFRIAIARGAVLTLTFVFLLLCVGASSIHFLARPHVVSWIMTIAWFWILDSAARGAYPARLFWLPLLMLLWANLHGGFVTGFILLGVFLAGSAIDSLFARDGEKRQVARKATVRLALVFAMSAVASLANPYGYKLHAHVYAYLTNRFFMQHIEEFRRPIFSGLPEQCFVLLLLLAVVGIVAARARLEWPEWLLILFSAVSGLYAARNLPVAAMLLTMVVPPLFSHDASDTDRPSGGFKSRMHAFGVRATETERSLRGHLWLVVAVFVILGICLHQGTVFGKQLMHSEFSAKKFPVKALDTLKQQGGSEPIFTIDFWGGYLIYRFYPERRVLVDDRHDLYGEPFLREYLKILHAQPGWESALDAMKVNLILIPTKSELSNALRTKPTWKPTYEDDVATIFERVGNGR